MHWILNFGYWIFGSNISIRAFLWFPVLWQNSLVCLFPWRYIYIMILFYSPYQILLFSRVLWICSYCLSFLLVSVYIVMSFRRSVCFFSDCVPNVLFALFIETTWSLEWCYLSPHTQKIYICFVQAPLRTSNPIQGLRYSETELQFLQGSMYFQCTPTTRM